MSESFGVFFVDLLADKERAFRCGNCGEMFHQTDRAEPTPASPPPRSAAELRRERAARAVQIEDELAALKKRAGR